MKWSWFKLHHDLPGDIKLRKFTPQEKWAWVCLLCLASQSGERGFILGDDEDIADFCEFNSTQDWLYFKDKLIVKGMLEPLGSGKIYVTHWEERQYKKPSDRPDAVRERVQRHREQKKNAQETPCNAPETPCNVQRRGEEIRGDKKREESKNQEKGAKPPSFFELFQETFNADKPSKWARLVVMNAKRKQLARQLAKECGGEKKAIEVLKGALRAANLEAWYQSKDLTFENFASNGKIIQLYEKQVEASGDMGQQIAQDSIGIELTRLGMSGLLPESWGSKFGCSLVSDLSAEQAGQYLSWLRQQEVSHAA
jgi:hypothetical protein